MVQRSQPAHLFCFVIWNWSGPFGSIYSFSSASSFFPPNKTSGFSFSCITPMEHYSSPVCVVPSQ